MIGTLTAIYVGGWMLTTCAILTMAQILPEATRPTMPKTFAGVSVIAGALWPLLLVGVAELGSVMTYAKLSAS